MSDKEKICARCGKSVIATAEYYDVQEKMHWLCFHLEFEHEGDPDAPCSDPSCPWWHIEIFREKLKQLSIDPEKVLTEAINQRWKM